MVLSSALFKEALSSFSPVTFIEIQLDSDTEPGQSKRRRFLQGTILTNYIGDFAEGIPLAKILALP
jgi:hypothetical protein